MAMAKKKPGATPLRHDGAAFTAPELARILSELQTRYDGAPKLPSESPARTTSLHGLMKWRRQHFHNLSGADPPLAKPYDTLPKFQSDLARQKHVELKARLLENPYIITVKPMRPTEKLKTLADDAEQLLNKGMDDLLERLGLDVVGALADGVIIDGQTYINWRYDSAQLPSMGDANERDELPADSDIDDDDTRREKAEERDRYEEQEGGRYRETAASQKERHKLAKARAGLPFWIDVPDPQSVYPLEDRSPLSAFAMVAQIREVPLLEYRQALKGDGLYLSLHDLNKKITIEEEKDKPADWLFSGLAGYPRTITVALVETRDEVYELAKAAGEWEIIKSFRHYNKMPLFARAVGVDNGSPDPALRFEPALEGVFRTKEAYDRMQALYFNLGEMTALPFAYIKRGDGTFVMDDDGMSRKRFSRDAAHSFELADGEELVWSTFEVGEAFVRGLEYVRQLHAESAPATGKAEISATTQPWAALLGQQQESVSVARLAKSIASAYRVMVRSMVDCLTRKAEEGGPGESVVVLVDGRAVEIDPEAWRELIIDVSVSPKSAAERVTTTELYASLRERGHPVPRRKLVEEGLGEADASEYLQEFDAEEVYLREVRPGLVRQQVAAYFGSEYVLGSDLQAVDSQGQPADPMAVLQANGVTPRVRPNVPGLGQGGRMPAMSPLTPPGAVPRNGGVA